MTPDARTTPGPDPLHDLHAYVAQPRVSGLAVSPDGRRLALAVVTLDGEGTGYATSLWESPLDGGPCRRLTRGGTGEAAPVWTPQGDLLFTARRPAPVVPGRAGGAPAPDPGSDPGPADTTAPGRPAGGGGDDDAPPALWALPAAGGEARLVATRPGGVAVEAVARTAGTLLLTSSTMPAAGRDGDDADERRARTEAGVSAVLHTATPVRFWDADLGPARPRLLAAEPLAAAPGEVGAEEPRLELRDLTGHVGAGLEDTGWTLTDDGRTAVGTWVVPRAHGEQSDTLVAVDVATGRRTTLADERDLEHRGARVSPDGGTVALVVSRVGTADRATSHWVATAELRRDADGVVTGAGPLRHLTSGWDRWPDAVSWTADGRHLVVEADEGGAGPLFLVDSATGDVRRLTADHGAYAGARVTPDGWAYALRSAYDAAPAPVRVRLEDGPAGAAGTVEHLPTPVPPLALPGRLEDVSATAPDGTTVRSWLCLPHGADAEHPAPLATFIHGGPLASSNAWSWRWNPWLLVSRGYAVLLPDPALSTGYGQAFVDRGWGRWGREPYTDLLAAVDGAVARDDVDGTRTAALGGSFGGYMANWVAGHTDRFDAVVTHASLWALDQFAGTTDAGFFWAREMTPQVAEENSPHRHADAITTPVLVVHGDKDYRVPVGEGLRLWWDLLSRSEAEDGSSPHRFLYYPDENHWVLRPGGAVTWYQTVVGFLDQHVLGKDWVQPDHV
ncbi:alpha/beta fold hydrolase [Pseudokineococcus lusitanus]|uniref:Dipeptidyl aminopeptidase/acylaminoacyl peptidase n=1 Tax=Pseudokineococcus lusitanus TaxID=763993 RepID=A0A3N1HQT0_9ACTN|nr:alpha/beta fold hydrolase [Pseudokineococcus lusitanus]ROP44799.1 dipeptidyl aminopeptidase/acylaminoacyl peptidase [Pseudokineococcus lusitanus]